MVTNVDLETELFVVHSYLRAPRTIHFAQVGIMAEDVPLVFDYLIHSPEKLRGLSVDQLQQRYGGIGFISVAAALGFRDIVLWGLSLNWANDV